MALSFLAAGATGYSAQNGASVTGTYPSISIGNLMVLIIGMKPSTANSGSVTTPDGWTPITSLVGAGGYGATLGADTGNTNIFAFYKVVIGETTGGTVNVTVANNNVCWAKIMSYSSAVGTGFDLAGTTGSDTAAGNVSIAFGANPGVTNGDHILAAMCIPTDVTTPAQFSAQAITQTGMTFAAITEVEEQDSGNGNDIGGFIVRTNATAGTASAAPSMTATAGGTTTNVRGPGIFIRIREVAGTTTASVGVETITLTDQAVVGKGGSLVVAPVESAILTDQAATGKISATASVGVEVITLTDQAANTKGGSRVVTGVENITLTEPAATAKGGSRVTVVAEVITLSDPAASGKIQTLAQAPVESITLTDQSVVAKGGSRVIPGVEAVALSDPGVTVKIGIKASVGVESITLSEQGPVAKGGSRVTLSTENLTLSDQTPSALVGVKASVGVESITLSDPSVTVSIFLGVKGQPAAELISLTDLPVTVRTGARVQVNTENLNLTEQPPLVMGGSRVQLGVEAVVLTAPSASVTIETGVLIVPVQRETITLSALLAIGKVGTFAQAPLLVLNLRPRVLMNSDFVKAPETKPNTVDSVTFSTINPPQFTGSTSNNTFSSSF